MPTAPKSRNPQASPAPDPEIRSRARRMYRELLKRYPDAHCELDHRNAYELLVATILSAQCTDVRVNLVTPSLFARYPGPSELARAKTPELEEMIRSTGFFRNKAKALIAAGRHIVEQHRGEVPGTMEALVALPGVARKTANVVLGNAFGLNEGVVVDTHVSRLAGRLGWSREKVPEKIERDLMAIFPRKNWALLSHLVIWHGRRVCSARKPDCTACALRRDCPRIGVEHRVAKK